MLSKKNIALILSLVLLSACMVQSKVQGRYVEDQGQCRDSAEGNIGRYEKSGMTTKDRNAQLVTLFSNCMAKHGWQVAKPKRTTTTGPHGPLDPYGSSAKTTTTTTSGTAQPQPMTQQQYQQSQQKLIQQQQDLARQQQQLQSTGQQNTQAAADLTRQQQELLRQQLQLQQQMQQQQRAFEAMQSQTPVRTTTTPLSPSGGMPPLSQPSGSYYQPARPYSSPVAEPYGSGAGRNF